MTEKKAPYDWRWENSINTKDNYIEMNQVGEEKYNPFRTNKALSNHPDTALYANEMNLNYHLDHKLQYDFLFHGIRKKKRTFKNRKFTKDDDTFALIQQYYKYSAKKTYEALAVLNEAQLAIIRKKMDRGGVK